MPKRRRSAQTPGPTAGSRYACDSPSTGAHQPSWGSTTHSPLRMTPLSVELRVQDHQVRVLARLQRADPVVHAEQPGRVGGDGAHGVRRPACRSTVTARRNAVSRVSVEPAIEPPSTSRATPSLTSTSSGPSVVAAVAEAGRVHGVGDERDAVRARVVEGQLQDGGVQMRAVVDQLDGDPLVLQQRRDRAGRAVAERRHRVEQVGGDGRARVDGLDGLLVRRVGVARSAAITPCSASSRTESRPPGSSVARVTILAVPRAASISLRTSAGSGSRSSVSSCAPLRHGEMNGPSKWMPARSPCSTSSDSSAGLLGEDVHLAGDGGGDQRWWCRARGGCGRR